MFTSLICLVCITCCNITFKLSQESKHISKAFNKTPQAAGRFVLLLCSLLLFTPDVPQKIHLGHCHAGPCQCSTEGASCSFSSSSLINTLLIGCWEDSSDDWLLWHSALLSDLVEPYWNQSEAVQIALFLMTLAEGSSTCDDIASAKHYPHHQASRHPRPLIIVSGECKKLLSTSRISNQDISNKDRSTQQDSNYFLQLCLDALHTSKGV